jgi:hypothetical protein
MTNTAFRLARSLTARATACGWMRSALRARSAWWSSLWSQARRSSVTRSPIARAGLRRDLIHKQFERRPRRAKHAEHSRGAAAEHLGTLVDLHDDRAFGKVVRVRVVRAHHQQQVGTHDRIIDGLRADHADAAHPMWIIIRHDVLTLDGMDQRRLETIGENLQLHCRSVAAGAAHDENTPRGIDPARDACDVLGARRDLRAWLQSLDAGDVAVGVRQHDVLRQCEMRNATARIGGGNRLMDHRGRLLRRDDGLRVKRDIAKQEIGLRALEVVNAVQLARHVAGDCQHGCSH